MAEKTPKREFPKKNLALLLLMIAIQAALILAGIFYQPQPQDVIHNYYVSVVPEPDGSLKITYYLNWEPLDASEPLSWIEIGMANENYTVDPYLLLYENVERYEQYSEDGFVALRIYFKEPYTAGQVFDISFTVNQKDMLFATEYGYGYEFVPGWFNAIRVENHQFIWNMGSVDQAKIYRGSLDYGEYVLMRADYPKDAFAGCETVNYRPFYDGDAFNELKSDKEAVLALCIFGAVILILVEVVMVDSFVSYGRGQGFITGYGHHMHLHGRPNPHYNAARDEYMRAHNSGRSSGGGGCACACACACAGGGRAGCSQKDTYQTK